MFRLIKRRKAIKTFIHRLSLELYQRFGQKKFYSLEEIDLCFEGENYDRAFIAYAYALFCARADFDSYFSQLNVRCTYAGLRQFVAKKHFGGISDFDAASIVRFAKGPGDSTYYESHPGSLGAGSGGDGSGHH